MAQNNNNNIHNNEESPKDTGLDKSIVGKLVSGLINSTPLSKWFGRETPKSMVRRRQDEEEDECYSLQPPSKRPKIPQANSYNNYCDFSYLPKNNKHENHTVGCNSLSEPVAGPSGVYTNKESYTSATSTLTNTWGAEGISNCIVDSDSDDDDGSASEYLSTTKTVSKLIENPVDSTITTTKLPNINVTETTKKPIKTSETNTTTRSLFSERNLNPYRTITNTSLSSRRPTFNASAFGSPNFIDKTLSTKKILNSPFYNGRTIYGGASAYGRKLGQSVSETATGVASNTQKSMKIKPVNQTKSISENLQLSKTARRILNTLEQYSTPISEAKKIPLNDNNKKSKSDGLLTKYLGANPYVISRGASNKELLVPTVPDLLKMKQKEKLQNSTENVRQIANKSQLNKETYKIGNLNDDNNKQKYTNKMKTSITSIRQKVQQFNDELVPEVNLPQIPLPITTLPKFDLVIPPPPPPSSSSSQQQQQQQSQSSTTVKCSTTSIITSNDSIKSSTFNTKTTEIKEQITMEKTELNKIEKQSINVQFKFSNPLIIAENLKTIIAINNFKFSEPLPKNIQKSDKDSKNSDVNIVKCKNNGENVNFKSQQQQEQTTKNSNDDFGQQFKLSNDKWECETCLVRNTNKDTKCVACTTPRYAAESENKPKSTTLTSSNSGFSDRFKPSSSTWECPSCMIRNNNDIINCVACQANKPGTNTEKAATTKIDCGFSFGIKPIESKDTWICDKCKAEYKKDIKECQKCDTNKNDLMNKFKPASGTWECSVCMIRNKNEDIKCAACETYKPGHKAENNVQSSSVPTFNFGIKSNNTSIFGGKPMEQTDFKFGIKSTESSKINDQSTKSFTFGVKPIENTNKQNKTSNSLTFESTTIETTKTNDKPTINNNDKPSISFDIKPIETWECKSCSFRNSNETNKCMACKVSKPLSFDDSFKLKSTQWECPSCLVRNKEEATSCVCCGVTKLKGKNVGLLQTPEQTPSTFNFGINKQSPNFQFGLPKEESKTKVPPPLTSTATTTFSFSTETDKPKESNPLLKPNEILPPPAKPATTDFQFNAPKEQNDNKKETTTTTSLIMTSTTTLTTSTTTPSAGKFNFMPATVNGDISLEKKSEVKPTPPPSSSSMFLSTPSSIQAPTFNFDSKPVTSSSSNLFKFGGSSSTPSISKTEPSSSAIKFPETISNVNSNQNFTATSKSMFSAPQFGSSTSTEGKPFVFGGNTSGEPPKKIPTFSFGEKATSATVPFNFSANNTTTTTTNNTNTGFSFSTSTPNFNFTNNNENKDVTAPAPTPAPTFQFGSGAAAKNGVFNFGSGASNNNAQKAVFNFGANQPTVPTPTGFNFGSAPAAPTTGGFNFAGGPPTFNFTEGTTGQLTGSQTQRKIRKALRRTHR